MQLLSPNLQVFSNTPECRHGHSFGLLALGLLQAQIQDPPDKSCIQTSGHTYTSLACFQRCQNGAPALRRRSGNLIDTVFAIDDDSDCKSLAALVIEEIGQEDHGDGQRVVQWRSLCQSEHIGICLCEKGEDLVEQNAEHRRFCAIHFLVKSVEQLLTNFWCCQLSQVLVELARET
jgi:hypothetical protein